MEQGGMQKDHSLSSSEDDTDEDDELVRILRVRGESKACVKKFKAGRKRIEARNEAAKISTVKKFCSVCSTITIEKLRNDTNGVRISNSFEGLRKSAETCPICHLVLMSLRHKRPEIDAKLQSSVKSEVKVNYHADGVSDLGHDSFQVSVMPRVHMAEHFTLFMRPQEDGVIHLRAAVTKEPDGKRREGESVRPLLFIESTIMIYTKRAELSEQLSLPTDPRPRREEKFTLMRAWLQDEGIYHKDLESPMYEKARDPNSPLPSKLIYLGPSPNLQGCRLRLVNSEEVRGQLKTSETPLSPLLYVTLSHRWGPTHHFTTTKANLSSRQEGFLFEELPKTYRDAAIVASRLGFEYLWIDAVCIVQDDSAEWLRESGKMGDIYRHASFTIASHCSENDSNGFIEEAFQRRGSIQLSTANRTFVRAAADLELDISKSPLSKRGWVLQERFLSTRILHFTTGMVYLETTRWTKSEDGLIAIDGAVTHTASSKLRPLEKFNLWKTVSLLSFSNCFSRSFSGFGNISGPTASSASPLEWFPLLEMYSTCSLTEEKDKLIAISGIAKIVQQETDTLYLAGIWADRLSVGLMWLNVDGPLMRPRCSRASTWSWAAWDGPIQFPLADEKLRYTNNCEFIRVGGVNGMWLSGPGELTIRTKVLDLTKPIAEGDLVVSFFRQSIYPEDLPIWEKDVHTLWDADQDPPVRLFNIFNAHAFRYTKPPWISDMGWIVFDSEDGSLKRDGHSIPLLCASMASFDYYCLHMVLFLVPNTQPGTFKRVGAGVIRKSVLYNLNIVGDYRSLGFEEQVITLV